MQINYRTKQLKKICENAEVATKKHGNQMAEKIHLRIDQIRAASSIEELIQYSIGRCHPLHGNREGQYAMDLTHPYRLVFVEDNNVISAVKIERIEDYH